MLKVGLIFGGTGPEHEASIMSAKALIDNFDKSKFEISLYGIGKDGNWIIGENAMAEMVKRSNHDLLGKWIFDLLSYDDLSKNNHYKSYPPVQEFEVLDCIFPLVDGIGTEDGSLQGFLSFVKKPYVGCNILSAAQSYHKKNAKILTERVGVPVVKDLFLTSSTELNAVISEIEKNFNHWNLVVKPNCAGSSLGVSKISSESELSHAFTKAALLDHHILIEEYIEHTELFVGIMGSNEDIIVAEPTTFYPNKNGAMLYEDKLLCDSYSTRPAINFVNEEIVHKVKSLAEKIYRAVGCDGYARVDFFYSTDGKLFFNELNTAPTISPNCGFSQGMRLAGYSYGELLNSLVQSAIERHTTQTLLTGNWSYIPSN